MSTTAHRRSRSASALLLVAFLTGCTGSGDELDVTGFSAGACRDLAPTAQQVDRTLREAADEDIEPRAAAERLRDAQEELKPLRQEAAQPVSTAITELITRIGFFRISVDSNNYDGSQVDDVRKALDALAQECTA